MDPKTRPMGKRSWSLLHSKLDPRVYEMRGAESNTRAEYGQRYIGILLDPGRVGRRFFGAMDMDKSSSSTITENLEPYSVAQAPRGRDDLRSIHREAERCTFVKTTGSTGTGTKIATVQAD